MRYVFGDYNLDTQRYELRRAGESIPLGPQVFNVLAYLLAHRNRVVSRDELFERLWPDQFVTDDALGRCIRAARRALEDRPEAPRYITTPRGRGYRFMAPVQEQLHGPPEDGVVTTVPVQSIPLQPSAASSEALPPPVFLPTMSEERHHLADYRGTAYQAQGDYRRAIDCFRQTVASLEGTPPYERFGLPNLPAVLSRAHLAVCYAELGMFAEGSTLGEEGLRIAEAVAHPGSLMRAYHGLGLLALHQGDLPRAVPRLERAMGICQDADLPAWFPWLAAWRRHTPLPSERWRSPVRTRNAATGRMPCASSVTLLYGVSLRMVRRPQPAISRPSPSPRSWGCVRSWRTATAASARCMPQPVSQSRPVRHYLPPSCCPALWT